MPNVVVFNVPNSLNMRVALHPTPILDDEDFMDGLLGYKYMHGELHSPYAIVPSTIGRFPPDMFDAKDLWVPSDPDHRLETGGTLPSV